MLVALACSACGKQRAVRVVSPPPDILDLSLDWTVYRVAGFEGKPPTPVMKPVRDWRAQFRPDHTFRYAWRDTGTVTWEAIEGRWHRADHEPWARRMGPVWILAPGGVPERHPPDITGRDQPVLWWTPESGRPGGPYRPMWWISNIDPETRQFTMFMSLHDDDR